MPFTFRIATLALALALSPCFALGQVRPTNPTKIPKIKPPRLLAPIVHVVREDNSNVQNAEVFINGNLAGTTDEDGKMLNSGSFRRGDQIIARERIMEKETYRAGHASGSSRNWKYRVYTTSLVVNNDGSATPFAVTQPSAEQTIQIRKANTLIGIHLVASAEWDTSTEELAVIQQELGQASEFLYNATDGQFFFEQIELSDRKVAWDDADFRIHADKDLRPHCDFPMGFWSPGLLAPGLGHFARGTEPPRASSNWGGFKVYVHEFGHYGFGLYDEYNDTITNVACATHINDSGPFMIGSPQASCLMWHQWDAPKFCSSRSENTHNIYTWQGFLLNSCWGKIMGDYRDESRPDRYILQSPDTRGAIPGTLPAPIVGWQTHFNVDGADRAGLRAPFNVFVSHDDGTPAVGVHLWLDVFGQPNIEEGNTDSDGNLVITGAHAGDILRGAGNGVPISRIDTSEMIAFKGAEGMHGPLQKQKSGLRIVIPGNPATMSLYGELVSSTGALIITTRSFGGQSSNMPTVEAIFENGKSERLDGKFDPASQTFNAILRNPPGNAIVKLSASQKLDDGTELRAISGLQIGQILRPDQNETYAPNGGFALGHPDQAIVKGTTVCISQGADMGGLKGISEPMALSFATGGNTANFVVKFLLSGEPAKALTGAKADQFVIWRRTKDGKVEALKSVIHPDLGVIAATTDRPGTFMVGLAK